MGAKALNIFDVENIFFVKRVQGQEESVPFQLLLDVFFFPRLEFKECNLHGISLEKEILKACYFEKY